MTAFTTAAYCGDEFNPDRIKTYLSDIQQSGLTTVILGFLGIWENGDFSFNYYRSPGSKGQYSPLVSQGVFNPEKYAGIRDWPQRFVDLKQHGSVAKVFFSLGGWDSKTFTNIHKLIKDKQADLLKANFNALRQGFTVDGVCVIDGFDLDLENEEVMWEDQKTFMSFCEILFDVGFEVTFCPYSSGDWWKKCMQDLWDKNHKVSWWNLMCYAGGFPNRDDMASWIGLIADVVGKDNKPASYLVAGLGVRLTPEINDDGLCPTGSDSIESTFAKWKDLGLRGGFLWSYQDIIENIGKGVCPGQADDLKAYVAAINAGLS